MDSSLEAFSHNPTDDKIIKLTSFILIALTQIQLTQTRDNRRAATGTPYGGWPGERQLW
jgi:hypothetical protein